MSRSLFYCVITFELLASNFEWLVTGALAAALTCSGSAAIHACLLVWRGPIDGDLDIFALVAVLSTSCLIAIPLLNWSTTLRILGSRDGHNSEARTIMIYWGALVCVALITILTTFWKNTYYIVNWSSVDPIVCHHPRPRVDHGADQGYSLRFTVVDAEWIEENSYINPCQHSSFALEPALFHSYSDLQLMSREEYQAVGQIFSMPKYLLVAAYQYFATSLGMFLVSQGIWALCFGRTNTRQARDGIYSCIKSLSINVGP